MKALIILSHLFIWKNELLWGPVDPFEVFS